MVSTGEKLARSSVTSKLQITTVFPGVSSGVIDVYKEYVPRLVPRGPRSVPKRGRADGSSSGLPASKKSRQLSTHPGTPVIGNVLLRERIHMLGLSIIYLCL